MADDFYGYDDEEDEPKGRDNLFLWTVFILLLIGGAFACWLGSFYIFGHPENPRSYKILKKIGKIEMPQRFEVTAAPQGEFLDPQKLFERYARFSRLELDNENGELVRNYLRNYKETKRLATYCTGKFVILKSYELNKSDFFPNGAVTLAQASEFSQVLIEHVYPSTVQSAASILALLQTHTGDLMKLARTEDLSALVHVERVGDGRMLFTVVPLLYGSYQLGDGQFSLQPPAELNMEPGLPVIKSSQLRDSLKFFAGFREKHPLPSTEPGTEPSKQTPAPELVRVETPPPREPTPPVTPIPTAAPVRIAGKATPKPGPTKLASNKGSPTPAFKLAMSSTPRPRSSPTPFPAATPVPAATPMIASSEPPKVSASGVPLVPFLKAQRDPNLANTSSSWRTYAPGQAPPGRTLGLEDVAALADRGEIGERLYLRGDFRVTASSPNKAVLRDANKPDDQSPRVLVEYPSGAVAPAERERLSRDSSRPYQIYNVRRGPDGVVTIWVKEITQQ
jgi:hypothetical protein